MLASSEVIIQRTAGGSLEEALLLMVSARTSGGGKTADVTHMNTEEKRARPEDELQGPEQQEPKNQDKRLKGPKTGCGRNDPCHASNAGRYHLYT